jgi:hypothetical protein
VNISEGFETCNSIFVIRFFLRIICLIIETSHKMIKYRTLIKELSLCSSVPIQGVSKIVGKISGVNSTQQN